MKARVELLKLFPMAYCQNMGYRKHFRVWNNRAHNKLLGVGNTRKNAYANALHLANKTEAGKKEAI